MQTNISTMLCFFDYYDNYFYENNINRNISIYNIYNIIIKQFIYYFNLKDWKIEKILFKYNLLITKQV